MTPNSYVLKNMPDKGVETKRVIVVDPSLTDFIGHHAQYDISVVENSKKYEMEGIVLCHRSASNLIDKHVRVIRTFSEDMWGMFRMRRRVAFELKLLVLASISMLFVPSTMYAHAYRNAGRLKRWLARVFSQKARLKVRRERYTNSTLLRFFAYVLIGLVPTGIYKIRRGGKAIRKMLKWVKSLFPPTAFEKIDFVSVVTFPVKLLFGVVVLLLPRLVTQFFKGIVDTAGISNFVGRLTPTALFVVLGNHRYYLEAEEALSVAKLEAGDLVFFHMIIGRNVLETAVLCENIYSKTRVAPVVLFRYPASFFSSVRPMLKKLAFKKFEYLFESGRVRLASDSSRLIEEYSNITYVPMELFPIPHGVEQHSTSDHVSHANEQLIIAVLGNARGEKGFVEIVKMMRQLAESSLNLPVEFVIQANDPDDDAEPYVREIRNAQFPFPVSVLTKSLDKQSYEALINSTDVILAPYWQEVYSSRTSGVALEAIIGAKILITTENTWMSDQV